MKQILDACCGSRMFWFDKEHPATVFMDNGVYEISRGITTTIAKMRLKTLNNIQKSGYATLIYAKNVMKEWGV